MMAAALRIGSTAGRTPIQCAMMKILMATTPTATITVKIAKIRSGTIATGTTVKAAVAIRTRKVTKTSKIGSSAIQLPMRNAEQAILSTTTATGITTAVKTHGGMTATGMVRAAMISQIFQMRTKITSTDTSRGTPMAILMA